MSPSVPKPRPKKQKPRFGHRRDPDFTNWVRAQVCVISGAVQWINGVPLSFSYHRCVLPVQVAHVKSRGAGGDDRANVVSLCYGAHHQQHQIGTRSFERLWNVDLKEEAQIFWERYYKETGHAVTEG